MISSDPCHEEPSNKDQPSFTTPKGKNNQGKHLPGLFPNKTATFFWRGTVVSTLSRGVFFALMEAEVGSSAWKPMDK